MTSRFDRQERRWGRVGQNLIEQSTLAIVGADYLGRELVKSASILGVGNILLLDNRIASGEQPFLDMRIPEGQPIAKSMDEIIKATVRDKLNTPFRLRHVMTRTNPRLIDDEKKIDFIVNASNDPESQERFLDFARKRKIPYLAACASYNGGIARYYEPEKPYSIEPIYGFGQHSQGIIASNIFAGIIIEEFRKKLFKTNIKAFKGLTPLEMDATTFEYTPLNYYKVIEDERMMWHDEVYSLVGNDRRGDPRKATRLSYDGLFRSKKILIVGAGALGCYLADILARLGFARIDLIDYDRFEDTNLNRQPLGYAMQEQSKSKSVSPRVIEISKIVETLRGGSMFTESAGIVGKIGDTLSEEEAAQYKAIGLPWFKANQYDAVIGCLDTFGARAILHRYSLGVPFTYIDGGSDIDEGRATVFVPGKTRCVDCSYDIVFGAKRREDEAALMHDRWTQARQRYASQHSNIPNIDSCRFVAPSVNMINQTAAGLVAGELLRVLAPETYGSLIETIFVQSNGLTKLSVTNNTLGPCNCLRTT